MFACVVPLFRYLSMVARERETDGRRPPGSRCGVRYQAHCAPGDSRVRWLELAHEPTFSGKLVEQRLGVLEVDGIKALGEPAVDRGEEIVGLSAFALIAPQSGEARCCAQF